MIESDIRSKNDKANVNSNYYVKYGIKMSIFGFGTFKVEDLVKCALQLEYRHINTAAVFKKDEGVRCIIKENGISREEIFLTTKV